MGALKVQETLSGEKWGPKHLPFLSFAVVPRPVFSLWQVGVLGGTGQEQPHGCMNSDPAALCLERSQGWGHADNGTTSFSAQCPTK